jgi:asparagine synthase (glutamine-hydrolysing)
MCGIFGIVSKAGVNPDALWFGTHRVTHRGPDDWGFVSAVPLRNGLPRHRAWRLPTERQVAQNYCLGLGSRRLSILDLSIAGRQPMNLPGSDLWIVFNGEIYNYLELRTELSREFCFSTETDTEVLLAAYQKWGLRCLSRLNGMFAFAIWDSGQMRLFLARDRFGEKPLYYSELQESFIFASEMKQFFEHPACEREVDRSALSDFFLLSVQDHDQRTFLKRVKQLPPAHWMELNFLTGDLRGPVRYWMPEIADDLGDSHDAELQDSLVPLLADSVRLRLRSDVPVGICLSGGIDSSTICSLAASQNRASPLSAYTLCFPGFPEDESQLARKVAQHVGIPHRESSFDATDLWDKLDDFVYFQDGPTGGASIFASWKIFQAARFDGSTVLLNGQGCDELLAGYSKFFFFWWQILLARRSWSSLAASLTAYIFRNGLINWNLSNARRYLPRSLRERLKGICRFVRPDFAREASLELNIGCGDSLNRRLWRDLSELSLPCLLHWEDRNSMAAGAEARLPFLDYRLVELVLRTSAYTKLKAGFTKYSLRRAMQTHLPSEICWQKLKRGFETPARQWFRTALASPMEDMLLKRDSLLADCFDLKALGRGLRNDRNAPDALTEFDWFKLATATLWLDQLKRVSLRREPVLVLQ